MRSTRRHWSVDVPTPSARNSSKRPRHTESASRPKSMTVRSPSATAISSALRRDEPWKPLVSKSRSATSPFANARVVTNTGQVNAGSLRGNILVRRPQPLPPTDTGGGGGGDGSNVGGGANGIGDGNVQGGRSGSNGSAMVVLARERKLTRSASQGGHQ
ncbi:hypothetical protein BC828DRAFT_165607 [Blastocladiella britannica]|nr:hypothetical protein BC828DRAFT_165607 [Blastocladiella britannica]